MHKKPIFSLDPDQLKRLFSLGTGDQASAEEQPPQVNASGEAKAPPAGEAPSADVTASLVGVEQPGGQIGPYKLLRILGEGGMGIVYLAEQEDPIRRRVALKIVKPGMDSKQVIARFEAERQALALLDHPNVAHVYDAGTTETGRPYFAMEYVQGIPITEHCDRQKLTIEERLKLFVQVCEAIQHAHQKGIIHRDIKPSNIQVCIQGAQAAPKVIDFGVAKALSQPLTERTLVTEQGQLIGTPEYISPEQAEMTNQDIDTRSDIYSLGVLLYELLTGTLPFESQTLRRGGLEQMRQVIRETEPKTPSTRVSSLDGETSSRLAKSCQSDVVSLRRKLRGDLDWITLKAMEKDRMRRYQTAHALAEDIERHLNNEPVLAGRPGTLYRFQKLIRRNKGVFVAVSAVAAVLVLGALVSTWQAVRATQAKREQSRLREEAVAAQKKEAALRYASDMSLAQQALAMNDLGRARRLLEAHRPSPGEVDLRGWEWRYLWQESRSDALLTLCRQSSEIWSLAVSPDGKWLAVGEYQGGRLSIWDLATGQEAVRPEAGDGPVRVAFSPGEELMAFSVVTGSGSANPQHKIRLWNRATQQTVAESLLGGECMGLAFCDDGRTLITYAADPENEIALWQVPEGAKLRSCPLSAWDESQGTAGTPFAIARNGTVGAVAPDATIHLIDLSTGKERWQATAADESVKALALSPDGRILASGAGFVESDIRLWDVAAGKEIVRLQGHRVWVSALVFWPDGKTLASASADQTIRLWDLTDVANVSPPRVLRGHKLEVWRLALLPDSKTLVSGCKDHSVYLWDTTTARRGQTRIILPTAVAAWRFAADGKSVLTVDFQGHAERWKGTDFHEREFLMDLRTKFSFSRWPSRYSILISNQGQWVAAGSADGTIRLWDLRKRTSHQSTVSTGWVIPVGAMGEEQTLVVLHVNDGSFHEWDLASWQQTRSWQGLAQPPLTTAFSADERLCVMFAHGGANRLLDLATGHQSDHKLNIADVGVAAFSPDGHLFAAACPDGYAKLWETATFREYPAFRGFLMGVHSVAFSPDGKRLAVGSAGSEAVKLWDVESCQELLTLEGQGALFTSSAFSPHGNIIGARNGRGQLHLWRAPSWEEIEAAEKRPKSVASP